MPPLHNQSLVNRQCSKISTRAKLPLSVQRTEQVLIVVEEEEGAVIHVFSLWVKTFETYALVTVGKMSTQTRTRLVEMGDCLPRIDRVHSQEISRQRDAWQTVVYF